MKTWHTSDPGGHLSRNSRNLKRREFEIWKLQNEEHNDNGSAKAMLHDQDLPMHLWAKVARTTMYVQNRTPHRVLDNKTPEEDFSREKP